MEDKKERYLARPTFVKSMNKWVIEFKLDGKWIILFYVDNGIETIITWDNQRQAIKGIKDNKLLILTNMVGIKE